MRPGPIFHTTSRSTRFGRFRGKPLARTTARIRLNVTGRQPKAFAFAHHRVLEGVVVFSTWAHSAETSFGRRARQNCATAERTTNPSMTTITDMMVPAEAANMEEEPIAEQRPQDSGSAHRARTKKACVDIVRDTSRGSSSSTENQKGETSEGRGSASGRRVVRRFRRPGFQQFVLFL